jgi:hypothetical protein
MAGMVIDTDRRLRHTSPVAPTLDELKADIQRQAIVKMNAELLEKKYLEESQAQGVVKEQPPLSSNTFPNTTAPKYRPQAWTPGSKD